jgi:hypothetical protein
MAFGVNPLKPILIDSDGPSVGDGTDEKSSAIRSTLPIFSISPILVIRYILPFV